MTSRRSFLALGAAAFSATFLPSSILAERLGGEIFTPATVGAYLSGLMKRESLAQHVGSLFLAYLDGDRVAELYLREVTEEVASAPTVRKQAGMATAALSARRAAQPGQTARSFSAVFTTSGKKIPQGTYVLDHGRLGRVAVFLVSAQDLNGRETAVATFTRLA